MNPVTGKIDFYFYAVIIFTMALGIIWVRTATVKETYRYVQLEKQLRKQQQEVQQKRVEWLELTAPKTLKEMAERLNLKAPKNGQLLRFEDKQRNLSDARSQNN